MRVSDSRLADELIFGAWVTTNVSQRISRPLVHLPVPVTFNMSQLGTSMALFSLFCLIDPEFLSVSLRLLTETIICCYGKERFSILLWPSASGLHQKKRRRRRCRCFCFTI